MLNKRHLPPLFLILPLLVAVVLVVVLPLLLLLPRMRMKEAKVHNNKRRMRSHPVALLTTNHVE
jgi:hypothetical protein